MTKQILKKRIIIDFQIGYLIHVNVPKIDRFGIDHPSLPCKIVEDTKEKQFRLGCKFGIINVCYSAGEHAVLGTANCSELDEIPPNAPVAVINVDARRWKENAQAD
ncbi:1094_t:CDS:2, partial [Cetraspora pellucida]